MSVTNSSTPAQVATDDGMPEVVEETTAQRLVRELRESDAASSRLKLQFDQGVVSPMTLAEFIGVRPQQIYGAIRDGKLKTVQLNNTQKKVVERGEAIRYASEYLDRRAAKLLQQAKLQAIADAFASETLAS